MSNKTKEKNVNKKKHLIAFFYLSPSQRKELQTRFKFFQEHELRMSPLKKTDNLAQNLAECFGNMFQNANFLLQSVSPLTETQLAEIISFLFSSVTMISFFSADQVWDFSRGDTKPICLPSTVVVRQQKWCHFFKHMAF